MMWLYLFFVALSCTAAGEKLGDNEQYGSQYWCELLSLSDAKLWQMAIAQEIGSHCKIIFGSPTSTEDCEFYVKGRPSAEGYDGMPQTIDGRGTGCVVNDFSDNCYYDDKEYSLLQKERDSMCTESVVRNAAAQIKYGIRNGFCTDDPKERCEQQSASQKLPPTTETSHADRSHTDAFDFSQTQWNILARPQRLEFFPNRDPPAFPANSDGTRVVSAFQSATVYDADAATALADMGNNSVSRWNWVDTTVVDVNESIPFWERTAFFHAVLSGDGTHIVGGRSSVDFNFELFTNNVEVYVLNGTAWEEKFVSPPFFEVEHSSNSSEILREVIIGFSNGNSVATNSDGSVVAFLVHVMRWSGSEWEYVNYGGVRVHGWNGTDYVQLGETILVKDNVAIGNPGETPLLDDDGIGNFQLLGSTGTSVFMDGFLYQFGQVSGRTRIAVNPGERPGFDTSGGPGAGGAPGPWQEQTELGPGAGPGVAPGVSIGENSDLDETTDGQAGTRSPEVSVAAGSDLDEPTAAPTTPSPTTDEPTTLIPTLFPTWAPTPPPSGTPSAAPSVAATLAPSTAPSGVPSLQPTVDPSASPTADQSLNPTAMASDAPSNNPSASPSNSPSVSPTGAPTTASPTTSVPTWSPTGTPTTESPTTAAPTKSGVFLGPGVWSREDTNLTTASHSARMSPDFTRFATKGPGGDTVTVYQQSNASGNWDAIATIEAPHSDAESPDSSGFGASFAWSEDNKVLVIGAPREKRPDEAASGQDPKFGAVYVFEEHDCTTNATDAHWCTFAQVGEVQCLGQQCGEIVHMSSDGRRLFFSFRAGDPLRVFFASYARVDGPVSFDAQGSTFVSRQGSKRLLKAKTTTYDETKEVDAYKIYEEEGPYAPNSAAGEFLLYFTCALQFFALMFVLLA